MSQVFSRPARRVAGSHRAAAAVAALATVAVSSSAALAVTNPFTETFTADGASWGSGQTSSFTAAAHSSTGGPAGAGDGFISATRNHTTGSTVVVLRGQDNFNSSGDAFVGNWQAAGVTTLSFDVMHNNTSAPSGVTFFARFAVAANSPAFSVQSTTPVPANTWTHITIPVSLADYQANPSLWNYEAAPLGDPALEYASIFSAVANVQLLAAPTGTTPTTGSPVPFTYSLDNVSIVPEPASLAALGLVAGPLLLGRRLGRRRVGA
jgi:hypothetical protein